MQLCGTRTLGLILVLAALPIAAQVRDIDSAKLPQTSSVQAAFRSAQDLEPYAQAWTTKWNYDVPETQVQDKLSDDLNILSKALQSDPSNHELQLLTGLVAHFAYNVSDDAAFQVAVDDLTKAAAADPSDIRGEWFLGIHQCQSLQVVDGMNRLLKLEEKFKNPPADFWGDYITCATVAMLPAHTLRAIDRAIANGQPGDGYSELTQIANSRYKNGDLTKPIPAHDAWADDPQPNARDPFTSYLCGASFIVDAKSDIHVPDISAGTCAVTASPPAKKGEPAPTFLFMVKTPTPGQSLDNFVRSYLKSNDADTGSDKNQVKLAPELPCPVERCLSFDIFAPGIYWKQGGAHILVEAFERDQPRYDGLPFEKPQGPLMREGQHGRAYFRAEPRFHRIGGKLYYLVLLDSNQQIFAASKAEFDEFLKSIVVE
ncbi:MAG TPA: hypothetical protein VFA99_12695 [Acidobacteriaceae bacterium]|nr:hypothetical protein [Acidobacteriaceae bacterium]